MRAICVIASLLAVPFTAGAQSALGPIGLPLPAIGLPLPSIGLSPAPGEMWRPALAGPKEERPREAGRSRRRPSVVYFMPAYPWIAPPYQTASPQAPPPTPAPAPLDTTGRLRLEVEPADRLQLFVDGVFVGMLADLGNEIDLPPGSPRIEIRAPGYKTLTFEAQIVAARTITYRGALDRDPAIAIPEPLPPPPPAPAGSRTVYFIPGCYLGNVSPANVNLPAGCDLARLTTIVQ